MFDETLSFIAADEIAAAMDHRPVLDGFYSREGIAQLYYGDDGLHGGVLWTAKETFFDSISWFMAGGSNKLEEAPKCCCPDWMECYCGSRENTDKS